MSTYTLDRRRLINLSSKKIVVFKNWDGTILKTQFVSVGGDAVAPSDPTRPDDESHVYAFDGWDKSFSNIQEDTVVTATYKTGLLLYKNGVVTSGYSFVQAGYYGASSIGTAGTNRGFNTNNSGKMSCIIYDGSTSAAYGCGFRSSELTRDTLSNYSNIYMICARGTKTETDDSAGMSYRDIGIYTSTTPSHSNAVMSHKITSSSATTFSFSISTLLDSTTAETLYLGGGCLSKKSYSPGYITIYITKIWII